MELKNATLAALLITLLSTRPVESAGDKRTGSLLVPTLQVVGDHLASTSESEIIGQPLHIPSTEEASVIPVEVEDPIASSPEGQRFVGGSAER